MDLGSGRGHGLPESGQPGRSPAGCCHADLDAACLSLEVPIDIQHLKQTDMSLALDWRLQVREAFETYFERGYVVTDFIGEGQEGSRRNYYILLQMADDLRHCLGVA